MTQCSLTALRIGNFKAFADTQRIPLKPITLIFGPNSAGKSSVIHSLAFVHEAQFGRLKRGQAPLDVHETELGGASIDLGGFMQFVYRHDTSTEMEWGAELRVCDAVEPTPTEERNVLLTVRVGTSSSKARTDSRNGAPHVQSVEFVVDGEPFMKASYRESENAELARLRVDTLNMRHPRIQKTLVEAVRGSNEPNEFSLADYAEEISNNVTDDKISLTVRGVFGIQLLASHVYDDSGAGVLGNMALNGNANEYFWWMLQSFVRNCTNVLDRAYSSMEYLGPIRTLPPRHFTSGNSEAGEWNTGNSSAWDVLMRDEAVRERVNLWLRGRRETSRAAWQEATLDEMAGNQKPSEKSFMTTQYELSVDRYTANSALSDVLAAAFSEPLTLLKRREMLTKELAAVYAELNDMYEADQARVEQYAQELEPWITRIKAAQSTEEADSIRNEAMEFFAAQERRRMSDPAEWEEIQQQQDIAQAQALDAKDRADKFLQALDERRAASIHELRLWDYDKKTMVSFRDVGFGISQVLPVLATAYGSRGRVIAIEQPEIHLHPALQAELGDVFIESATGESQNTFILETHSEHLILRLLRRVREKKISPADMCVLFVEPTDHGSQVRELEYDEDGDFIDEWPGGFFEEAYREKFAGR